MTAVLPHQTLGDGSVTVVFAHGFTQTGTSWLPVARLLIERSPNLRCVMVDLPGHGSAHDVHVDLADTAALLLATGQRAHYVGYSLGARSVIQAMRHRPDEMLSAVLISGTAGITDDGERAARQHADEELARHILDVGTDAFIQEWLAQPLFAHLPKELTDPEDRRRNTPEGLASSLRMCGQGATVPMWDVLASTDTPLLALAGSRDDKYVALARRMATVATHGRLHVVDGAGHGVHLEQPGVVAREIAYWINNPNE
ncbi:MAG: alpha/beta fold hydrolase [Ilumatobacteraceae bacterium]